MTANTVASRKAKARTLQQLVIELILRAFPSLTVNDLKSVPMGVPGPDVWLSEAARKLLNYDIECKNQESLQIWAALDQVENRKKQETSTRPLLIFKRAHTKPYVALPLTDFIELLQKVNNVKQNNEQCTSDTRPSCSVQSQGSLEVSNVS